VEITYAEGLTYPEDDVIVSRLHSTPDYSPEDSILPNPGKYYVLRQFGNADAAAPDAIKIIDVDGITESIASNSAYVHLYTRDYFGEGDSWSVADSADMIDEGDASIFFNELVFGNEGQFVMGVDDSAFVGSEPTTIETEITTEENLFPNPSTDGWYHLQLANKQADVSALIRITDMRGAIVHHFVVRKSRINQEQHFHLPQTGSYILIIEYSDGTYSKIPLVRS